MRATEQNIVKNRRAEEKNVHSFKTHCGGTNSPSYLGEQPLWSPNSNELKYLINNSSILTLTISWHSDLPNTEQYFSKCEWLNSNLLPVPVKILLRNRREIQVSYFSLVRRCLNYMPNQKIISEHPCHLLLSSFLVKGQLISCI